MAKAEIGSISHGTLRTQDLLRTFADTLQALTGDHGGGVYDEARGYAKALDELDEQGASVAGTADAEKTIDAAQEVLDELDEQLNEHAPPGCYFGNIGGDGSDFGFWTVDIDEACASGDGVKVEAGMLDADMLAAADEAGAERVYAVSDHGNVTCYSIVRTLREEWSVV